MHRAARTANTPSAIAPHVPLNGRESSGESIRRSEPRIPTMVGLGRDDARTRVLPRASWRTSRARCDHIASFSLPRPEISRSRPPVRDPFRRSRLATNLLFKSFCSVAVFMVALRRHACRRSLSVGGRVPLMLDMRLLISPSGYLYLASERTVP